MKFSVRKLSAITRTYRDFKRYQTILRVMLKYGFGDLVDTLKLRQFLEVGLKYVSGQDAAAQQPLTRAERLRMALEELGPTFVKFGQVLSTRPDLVPLEYVEELAKLQDQVPPFAYAQAREIIREELGGYPEEIFASVDATPLAAASIGQAHQATLMDGSEVVIKVQRPGIEALIEVDLEIMMFLAGMMESHLEEMERWKPTEIVEEFARTLEKEIDYRCEANHMERFALELVGDETVVVPKVYRTLTTARVITMELVRGVKISDFEKLQAGGYDLPLIAHRGALTMLKQVFELGVFHADPHPGNIFILPGNVICFIDFGMVGRISQGEREIFANLLACSAAKDEKQMAALMLCLTYFDREPQRDKLERDLAELLDEYLFRAAGEMEIGAFFESLMDILSKRGMRLKPNLFLMMKAVMTVEKFGRRMDPGLRMFELAAPFVKKALRDRFAPLAVLGSLVDPAYEALELLRELPGDTRAILKQIKEGKLKVEFAHQGLKPLYMTLHSVTDRLVFAVVLAALIIGHSLLTTTPGWHQMRIYGFVGFVISGIIGFWLLVSMMRSRKM